MYPQVASLASLYGGANGVQNTGRVAAPPGTMSAPQPQQQQDPQYFRTGYMPPVATAPQAPPMDPRLMQMTPAQRQLYARYMRLPGQQPATAPRPMFNPQTTAPIYAAAQKPPQSGTAQYQSAPTPQPMSPTPQPTFVNSTNNDFLTTPTMQQPTGPQGGGMAQNWNPGVGGLAQYYMR